MPKYQFNYKDGSLVKIDMEFGSKDASVSHLKAGNTKTRRIKLFGTDLIGDQVAVSLYELYKDSEGDNINPGGGKHYQIFNKEYFVDMIDATNGYGIVNQAKICIDAVIAAFAEQTRVFRVDGTFVEPVYFKLEGTIPDNDPDFDNGTITATIEEANGYADLEIRFRGYDSELEDWGAWGDWEAFAGPVTKIDLVPGKYEAQAKSTGTALMIEPVEEVTI